jgi:hypothetical protein
MQHIFEVLSLAMTNGMLGATGILLAVGALFVGVYNIVNKMIDIKSIMDQKEQEREFLADATTQAMITELKQAIREFSVSLKDFSERYVATEVVVQGLAAHMKEIHALATENKEELLRRGYHTKETSLKAGLYDILEKKGLGLSDEYLPDIDKD